MATANAMVVKMLQVVAKLKQRNPKLIWFLENPALGNCDGAGLHNQAFMAKYEAASQDFCLETIKYILFTLYCMIRVSGSACGLCLKLIVFSLMV